MSDPERHDAQPVRPGSILRAMQASAGAAPLPDFGGGSAGARSAAPFLPRFGEADGGGAGDAELRVERDGDRVRRIVCACACGREIVIDCDYAESLAGDGP